MINNQTIKQVKKRFKEKLNYEGIVVLSLFDGMSCGQLALERAGIKVKTYLAAEIHKPSIKVTQDNYPNTIQLGDVTKVYYQDGILYYDGGQIEIHIDLFIGGSPCTDLSRTIANKLKLKSGLDGVKSKLFYEYLRLKEEIHPLYFLLENVESMKLSDKEIITEFMEVEPVMIDSTLLSAQDRKRYYWTSIPNIEQPKDKELYIKDIALPLNEVPENLIYKDIPFTYHGDDKRPVATLHLFNYESMQRVYGLHQKAPTLTQAQGGHTQKKIMQDGIVRRLTPLEYERLQTVPDNYTSCVANGHRYNMLGNGWTVDVIAHIFNAIHNDLKDID